MNNALPCNLNKAIYTNDITLLNNSTIKNYNTQHIEPDALEYSKFFYAKHHIPGIQNRPGNNSYPSNAIYKIYLDNYNLQCYN
jgi:hypothetical protein